MRKLINLLASITLITGVATTVASCDTGSKATNTVKPFDIQPSKPTVKQQNEEKVASVETKINDFLKGKNLTLKIPKAYNNLSDDATIVAINLALYEQGLRLDGNPGTLPTTLNSNSDIVLPTGEWADLSYSDSSNFTNYQINSIKIDVKVGSGLDEATGFIPNLKVQAATDAEVTNHIKEEITKGLDQIQLTNPLDLPYDIGADPTTSDATKAINVALDKALKAKGVTLNGDPGTATGDWSDITYQGTIPAAGTAGNITIRVEYGGASPQTIDLPVIKAQTNQQMATAISNNIKTIINSISDKTLNVLGGLNLDVTNSKTRSLLNEQLKAADTNDLLKGNPGDGTNPPTGDFSKIYYTGGNLTPSGGTKDVGIDVISNGDPKIYGPQAEEKVANLLKVKVAKTDQEKVNALVGEVTNHNVTLDYGKNYNTAIPDDSQAILDKLKANNSNFTSSFASDFSGATLGLANATINMEATQTEDLTMNVTWNGQTYSYDNLIQAKVNNTWQQKPINFSGPRVEGQLRNAPVQIGSTLYLDSTRGLYESTDNGNTWDEIARDGLDILQPPVKLGNYTYFSTNTSGDERSHLWSVGAGQINWIPVQMALSTRRSIFQAQPARFNAGTAEQSWLKIFYYEFYPDWWCFYKW